MDKMKTPFTYIAAADLDEDEVLGWFIDGYRYSGFINSRRNVFIIGHRGSGKSMLLLHQAYSSKQNAVAVLNDSEPNNNDDNLSIGVFIPCRSPILWKDEGALFGGYTKTAVNTHLFVLAIFNRVLLILKEIEKASSTPLVVETDVVEIKKQMDYILDIELEEDKNNFFANFEYTVNQQLIQHQKLLNKPGNEQLFDMFYTFELLVYPFFRVLEMTDSLRQFHITLMFDDADILSRERMELLNMWIGYRDIKNYSIKASITRKQDYVFKTVNKGTILEEHDFTVIDLEYPHHGRTADYGDFAEAIIKKRLKKSGIDTSPEKFLPISPTMERELLAARNKAEEKAKKKFPDGTQKQIDDYAYKQTRAIYFRKRSIRSNRPPYSGFDLIRYLSTGIIRNLLEPCSAMYLEATKGITDPNITAIEPAIQTKVIRESSLRIWDFLESDIYTAINCKKDESRQVYMLISRLSDLFRKRLFDAKSSEPCTTSFSVSGWEEQSEKDRTELERLFDIAEQAQMLYIRHGASKDEGRVEKYYVLNRYLLPARGLDPYGQLPRTQLPAKVLLEASKGRKIPYKKLIDQEGLFDE